MKNAPDQTSIESAPSKANSNTAGSFPRRPATVTAATLAALLRAKQLTGLDAVAGANTTRLSAVVNRLTTDYGWSIQRRDVAAGTCDGRIAWVSVYWLSEAVIADAFDRGAQEWIESVAQARADQRQEAGKCRLIAARRNQARLRLADPRQVPLFAEVR